MAADLDSFPYSIHVRTSSSAQTRLAVLAKGAGLVSGVTKMSAARSRSSRALFSVALPKKTVAATRSVSTAWCNPLILVSTARAAELKAPTKLPAILAGLATQIHVHLSLSDLMAVAQRTLSAPTSTSSLVPTQPTAAPTKPRATLEVSVSPPNACPWT